MHESLKVSFTAHLKNIFLLLALWPPTNIQRILENIDEFIGELS